VVIRYRRSTKRRYFRGDAAFATPDTSGVLESEGYKYAIRLPANAVLRESIAWRLKRPVGRHTWRAAITQASPRGNRIAQEGGEGQIVPFRWGTRGMSVKPTSACEIRPSDTHIHKVGCSSKKTKLIISDCDLIL
jgi:hypothetical protein